MNFLAVEDPSWFYSSLAQSSAAVVGFVGAFLIYRIQDYISSWSRMIDELQSLQGRWSTSYSQVEARENAYMRAVRSGGVQANRDERHRFVDVVVEREADAAWRDLRPLLDRQRLATFPIELVWSAGLLGGLFLVGTLAPLMYLEAPANGTQLLWVAVVGSAVTVVAGAMLWRARQEYHRFKNAPLYRLVDRYYEDRLLQEEGYAEQEKQEREERARREQDRVAEEVQERQHEEAAEDRREAEAEARKPEREAERKAERYAEREEAPRDVDGEPG